MARGDYPSSKQDQFVLRFPEGMRDRIKEAADKNGRSMNAEIISKLARYDSLGGEVDAIWEVARSLAGAIDDASRTYASSGPLVDKINDVFEAVDEFGNVDRAKIGREYDEEASKRLGDALRGTIRIPSDLMERITAKAQENGHSVQAEILAKLEREYPPPADVMHLHIADIRRALDRYEQEKDPRTRMLLQHMVEAMVTSGDSLVIDWDEDTDLPY